MNEQRYFFNIILESLCLLYFHLMSFFSLLLFCAISCFAKYQTKFLKHETKFIYFDYYLFAVLQMREINGFLWIIKWLMLIVMMVQYADPKKSLIWDGKRHNWYFLPIIEDTRNKISIVAMPWHGIEIVGFEFVYKWCNLINYWNKVTSIFGLTYSKLLQLCLYHNLLVEVYFR